jgi:hypothetical protein
MTTRKTYSMVPVRTPAGWNLRHKSEWSGPGHSDYKPDKDQPEFRRHGVFAGGCKDYGEIHEIELRSNYSGSGKTAFGGAPRWPCVTIRIPFCEGEYALASQFATELGEFIDNWMKERNR